MRPHAKLGSPRSPLAAEAWHRLAAALAVDVNAILPAPVANSADSRQLELVGR